MSSRAWSVFRKTRVAIFSISTLLSLAWAVIFAILLLREWSAYNGMQRTIVIVLLAINSISAILLYLMIIVHLRLLLDAARVAVLLLFQLGGTVVFALMSPTFPCDKIGSGNDCRHVTSAVIIGGWVLSGFLLLYAFCLAAISSFPRPPPPDNPEAALTNLLDDLSDSTSHSPKPSINSQTSLLKSDEKRQSVNSVYSQRSFIQSYSESPARTPSPSVTLRSVSSDMRRQMLIEDRYGVYRSNTPSSIRSMNSTSTSSIRRFAQSPLPMSYVQDPALRASSPRPMGQQLPPRPLPNPFTDPVSRHGSPMSIASNSPSNEGHGYEYRRPNYMQTRPEVPFPGAMAQEFPTSSADRGHYVHQPMTIVSPHLAIPNPPPSLKPTVRFELPPRGDAASPGMYSVRSMSASIHTPSRNGSFSTSRSPSPLSGVAYAFPTPPRSAMVAPYPGYMHPGAQSINQVRRYGSVSNLSLAPRNPAPGGHASSDSGHGQTGAPDWLVAKTDRAMNVRQWRNNV